MKISQIVLKAENFYKQALWSAFFKKSTGSVMRTKALKKLAASRDFNEMKFETLIRFIKKMNSETVDPSIKEALNSIEPELAKIQSLRMQYFQYDTTARGKDTFQWLMEKSNEANQVFENLSKSAEKIGATVMASAENWKETNFSPDDYTGIVAKTLKEAALLINTFAIQGDVDDEDMEEIGLPEEDEGDQTGPRLYEEEEIVPKTEVEKLIDESIEATTTDKTNAQRALDAQIAVRKENRKNYFEEYRKQYKRLLNYGKRVSQMSPEEREKEVQKRTPEFAALEKYYDIAAGAKNAQKELDRAIKSLQSYTVKLQSMKERYHTMKQDPEWIAKERQRIKEYARESRKEYSKATIVSLKLQIGSLREQLNSIVEHLGKSDTKGSEFYIDKFTDEGRSLYYRLRDEAELLEKSITDLEKELTNALKLSEDIKEKGMEGALYQASLRGKTKITDPSDSLKEQTRKLEMHAPGLKSGDTKDLVQEWAVRIKDGIIIYKNEEEHFANEILTLTQAKQLYDNAKNSKNQPEIARTKKMLDDAIAILRDKIRTSIEENPVFEEAGREISARKERVTSDYQEVASLVNMLKEINKIGAGKHQTGVVDRPADATISEIEKLEPMLQDAMDMAVILANKDYYTPRGGFRVNTVSLLAATHVVIKRCLDNLQKVKS
jgi:hypothetical protein